MGAYSYSSTAASNTSIDGIGAAGSSSPANLDDLHRAQAAALANFVRDLGGATAGGTADVLTLALNDATTLPAYADMLVFGFIAALDNATTTPTLSIDSVGAKTIKKAVLGVETALAAGDIQAGGYYLARYRSAWAAAAGAFQLVNMNDDLNSPTVNGTLTTTNDVSVGDDLLMPAGGSINWNSGAYTTTEASGIVTHLSDIYTSYHTLWSSTAGVEATQTIGFYMGVNGASLGTFTNTPLGFFYNDGVTAFTLGSYGVKLAVPFSRGAPVTKTGDFTVADTDNWIIINKGSLCSVTMPSAASYPGREIMFKSITANGADSVASNIVPLASATASATLLATNDGAFCTVVSDGTNWVKMTNGS